jgi:NTE family protein
MRAMKRLILSALLALCANSVHAKTCLVLSGGGARGLAHVGVLKVLEREHVRIDCIVGTSMGSVVGSLYASGLSADEIEAALRDVDWSVVTRDASDRIDRPLRSRQQDRTFLVGAAIGYRQGKFGIPRALVQGQRFGLVLRGFLLPAAGIEDFDALATPFRAVATDIESGQMVVLERGDLPTAVRASMAVPGVLPPVEIDGRLMSDGGTSSNLPVGVARALGANHVIAIDISAPLYKREELTTPLVITDQMLTAMMRRQTDAEIRSLGPGDVFIAPELGTITSADFDRSLSEGIGLGEAAAASVAPALRRLAVPEADYDAWVAQRHGAIRKIGRIAGIELDNRSPSSEAVLRAYLREHPGDDFDRATIEKDIARLYGIGEFESVDYALSPAADGDVLRVSVRQKQWGQGSLRFGLRLEDDFNGSSNFDFGGRLRATEVNDRGGEWQLDGQIGKNTRLAFEFLQPIDEAQQFWVLPHAGFSARNQPLFFNELRALELRRESLEVGVDAGRWLSDWGSLGAGVFRRSSHYSARTANIDIESQTQHTAGMRLDFLLDTQDDAQFPRHGRFIQASLRQHAKVLGGDYDTTVLEVRSSHAIPLFDDDRLLFRTRAQYAEGNVIPGDETGFLGGFLDLSGFAEDARFGRHLALGQAIYYRSLATVFDRYRVFGGGSIEAGNTWDTDSEVSLDSLLWGGSVFVASESPLGALYFGYGHAEAGENSLYLFVGRPY